MQLQAVRRELVEVAKGSRPADLFIKGGTVINVYSGEFLQQNVAVYQDCIAYIGESEAAIGEHTKVIDAKGKYLSPGFIEAHAHPWIMYNPVTVTEKIVPLGTTTTVNDNLVFFLHMGVKGFKEMVNALKGLPGNVFWLARLVSHAEFNGEKDLFNQGNLRELLDLDEVLGSAEVTRWPLLYNGDPFLLEMMDYLKKVGKIADGHTAGCSYEKLNAIAATGVSACHEAITAKEAFDRLRLGMWTTLRNSSLRPDLKEIIKLITEGHVNTSRIIMTTDGPNPAFIEEEGFIEGLVRQAVGLGVPAMNAIQMVTINAATYLKLDDFIGGLAPGRKADILILPDLVDFRPDLVIAGGEIAAESGKLLSKLPELNWSQFLTKEPFTFPKSLLGNKTLYQYPHASEKEPVPVIYFKSNVITTQKDTMLPLENGYADISRQKSLVQAVLIGRNGEWITRGILERFAADLDGLASTYNSTTELLVIGRKPEAMAKAAGRVHEMGGGIVLVDGDEIIVEIPLPLAGVMAVDSSFEASVHYYNQLMSALQQRGFPFHDILYTLLFLTCDFLPGLRILPLGLYDVKKDEYLLRSQPFIRNVIK